MMTLNDIIKEEVVKAVNYLYKNVPGSKLIQVQKTRKDFEGDITLVVFPLLKISKNNPEITAEEIGGFLVENMDIVVKYNVIKGFLNLSLDNNYYITHLKSITSSGQYGIVSTNSNSDVIMVEYSSPNTNKPLHLGHIRNNLLGWSICKILQATGKKVIKTNIVNDRGIHICKSMLAWQKWGKGETPESSGKKGDHLVGDYYVRFDQEYKKQVQELINSGKTKEEAEQNAPLICEAREMLRKWESKDPEVLDIWKMMNGWVYQGFEKTYNRLGVGFDRIYYESDTYITGRDTVLQGVEKGVFQKRPDGSVWVDLTNRGMDEKVLLRSDGTSVYITQDVGTAQLRQNDYTPDKMIYVVGNEQNYHFKVLSNVLDILGFTWAKDLYHLSYGMVELPEGKMKSREGTIVDADDLMDEMISTARSMANELGKLEELTDAEKEDTYNIIGMGALKYFILKVDPAKNMTFNPKESIDFNGNTGPFIQYTHARICSLLRKAQKSDLSPNAEFQLNCDICEKEKILLKLVHEFPDVILESAQNYNPSLIANFIFDLAKEYNQFYHDLPILKEENNGLRDFRLYLSYVIGMVINRAMNLLGIQVPDRM